MPALPDRPHGDAAPLGSDVIVARQGIYDRALRVVGYELFFRSTTAERLESIGGTAASARVMLDSVLTTDNALTGSHPAYVNFTRDLLVRDVALQASPSRLVVEILESVQADPRVLAACRRLIKHGYDVALDDVESVGRLMEFEGHFTVAKVDFQEVGETDLERIMSYASTGSFALLAEKVETWDDFQDAIEMGFDLFQGFFLSRPTLVRHRTVRSFRPLYMQLLTVAQRPEVNFDELANIIKADLALTHRMLSFANSAHAAQLREITSLEEALVIQGTNGLRRAAMLLIMADVGSSCPDQLSIDSVSRARFCELMGQQLDLDHPPFELFVLGMFSLLDAILRVPVEEVIADLPLPDAVARALIEHEGPLAELIGLVESYELNDWSGVREGARALGVEEVSVGRAIMEAWSWAARVFEEARAA
jgi:EAL and modified HD-GYP domain-containing signal transduction protein